MAKISLPFTKMSAAGNDFVVFDNRENILRGDPSELTRTVSNRRMSVGADGVLILEKSKIADFSMKYFNSDGSYGGFCGNGGRCIARYAYLKGLSAYELSFESLGHVYIAKVKGDSVSLKMKDPKSEILSLKLRRAEMPLRVHFLDTGAPHVVVFLDENKSVVGEDLESVDVITLGRALRTDTHFGLAGTNVNFVSVTHNLLRVRTYERGVEEETLACGTGAVASALIAHRVKGMKSPITIVPRSNERLTVRFKERAGLFHDIYLEGTARISFEGKLCYDTVKKKIVE
jgi:diaminopimelate epimerase